MSVVKADAAAIRRAGELIREGRLIAFPTETVYGLGADATNGEAVARIFAAKGRPRFNPLIVHGESLAALERHVVASGEARRLAATFWPGPLTLVLPRAKDCALSDLVSAGLDTVAIRVPDHPVARQLLAAAERPLAAPSANRSGHVSATQAKHVAEDLGDKVAMVLDGGPTAFGIESTVIGLAAGRPELLRPGAIPASEIEAVLGMPLSRPSVPKDKPQSPGQLESHYAPRAAVRLNAVDVFPGEALLAFGPIAPGDGKGFINLSPAGDLIEAAANLFAALRVLDATGYATIAVMPIPEDGLGEAINDRLRRAAAPRT